MMLKNNFDNEDRYNLFRSVKDLLHPSISKENISEYKIILKEGLLPIRVYYPKKVSNMNNVSIYIPGLGKNTDSIGLYDGICRDLAIKLDKCLIVIDYFDKDVKYPNTIDFIYETIKYIYNELYSLGLNKNNISLIGDDLGGLFVNDCIIKSIEENNGFINKCVLLYPLISMDYLEGNYESFDSKNDLLTLNLLKDFQKKYLKEDNYYNKVLEYDKLNLFPEMLIVSGEFDPIKDEIELFSEKVNGKYYCFESNTHGFIRNIHTMKDDIYNMIKEFIEES